MTSVRGIGLAAGCSALAGGSGAAVAGPAAGTGAGPAVSPTPTTTITAEAARMFSAKVGSGRKRNDKGAALPRRRTPDGDAASVILLDDALDEREPEPPAAGPGRVAGLEGPGLFVGRHATAVVGHRDLDRLGLGPAFEPDLDRARLVA